MDIPENPPQKNLPETPDQNLPTQNDINIETEDNDDTNMKKQTQNDTDRTARRKNNAQTLTDMYGKKSGRTKPLQLNRARKKRTGAAIIGIILALGFFTALTWVGFYFFGGTKHFNDTNILISIDTPREITSGDNIELTIHYKNAQKIPLSDSQIRIKPPEGFLLNKTEPKANGTNAYHFKLGKLGPEESGKIIIKGTYYGTKDGNNELTAYLTYLPENFNSRSPFEKVQSTHLSISEIPLQLTVQAPDNTPAGAQTTFNLTLKNTSTNNIGPLEISALLPDQFTISQTTPETYDNGFLIESLSPNEEWTGSIQGTFKNSAQGDHQLLFETNIIIENKPYLQNSIKHFITVDSAELEARLSIDNFEKKGSVAPGKSFTITSQTINNGNNTQENAIVTLTIEEPVEKEQGIINWEIIEKNTNADITSELISEKRKRTTLIFNPENTPDLSAVIKNTPATQITTVPILSPEEFGGMLPGNTIIVSMNVAANGGAPTHTAPFEITLRSDTELRANSQPAGDPIIGVGPDGLTEVSVRPHDIALLVTNTLHEIQQLELVITLAPNVAYEKQLEVPAGEIQYLQKNRTIRWILNKLPTNVPQLPLTFRLDTITPIGDEEPKELISSIELTAIDSISQEPFKIKLNSIIRK